MFGFALWDRQKKTLTLARDRFGEKPVYYTADNRKIAFSSELSSLALSPEFDRTIDREALCHYFRTTNFPAPLTVYKKAKKLPPGHYLTWKEDNGTKVKCYWDWSQVYTAGMSSPFTGSSKEAVNELDRLLKRSVKLRMEADVSLGAFLSGGIDSSVIAALMQVQSTKPVKTFSIGFDVPGFNEAQHAKKVANHLGTDHIEEYITGEDALAVVPKLADIFDEPFADSSQIPTYLVSNMAKKHVTVALTGDGGDELFAGYRRYEMTEALWKKMSFAPTFMRRFAAAFINMMPPSFLKVICSPLAGSAKKYSREGHLGMKIKRLAHWLPARNIEELYKLSMSSCYTPQTLVLNTHAREPYWQPTFPEFKKIMEKLTFHDLINYLPGDILTKVDRCTMAVSLEGRIPLLDPEVAQFASSLPLDYKWRNNQGKWILREVLYRYIPKQLIDRPKMGFGVPMDVWLRGPLREWAEELLSKQSLKNQEILNSSIVQKNWKQHLSGQSNNSSYLWSILMFQAWQNKE